MPFADAGRPDPPAAGIHILRNFKPALGWAVALCFLVAISFLTVKLRREGTAWGYPDWLQQGAMLAFWVGGYLGFGHFIHEPCTLVRVAATGDVVLVQAWLWRHRREVIPRAAIAGVTVSAETDAEDDPYFRTRLVLADGRRFLVQQGHRRARQEAMAAALRVAIGLAASR